MSTPTKPVQPVPAELMDPAKARGIELLVWGLPAGVLTLAGSVIGAETGLVPGLPIFLVLAWTAILFALGLGTLGQKEFMVVERFGVTLCVKTRGWYWMLLPGIVDKVRLRDNFLAKEIPLYIGKDGKTQEIDFKEGGSAPVQASGFIQIGDPAASDPADRTQSCLLWTYRYTNPAERVAQILETVLRPLLQSETLEKANQNAISIADAAAIEAAEDLKMIGAYPVLDHPILIEDIDIPAEVQELRNLELTGKKKALERAAESGGWMDAALVLVEKSKDADGISRLDLDQALALVQQQAALDTIKGTGANMTFVSPNIGGVMPMITLNPGTGAKR